MADITEFQMMKVSSFTDGTDVYKGIKDIGYNITALPTVGIRLEGELRPSRHEQVETDQAKVTGRISLSGPNATALVDTTIASATVTARNVAASSGSKTMTFTNMTIKGEASGANNRSVQGAVYDFEADEVAIT